MIFRVAEPLPCSIIPCAGHSQLTSGEREERTVALRCTCAQRGSIHEDVQNQSQLPHKQRLTGDVLECFVYNRQMKLLCVHKGMYFNPLGLGEVFIPYLVALPGEDSSQISFWSQGDNIIVFNEHCMTFTNITPSQEKNTRANDPISISLPALKPSWPGTCDGRGAEQGAVPLRRNALPAAQVAQLRSQPRPSLPAETNSKTVHDGIAEKFRFSVKCRLTENLTHNLYLAIAISESRPPAQTPKDPFSYLTLHMAQDRFRIKISKYSQQLAESKGWRLNHFPGQPVPMLDNPFSEVKFPNIQSIPPLAQLEVIFSCPITCYLGEDTDPHLSTASFQVVGESDEVSPQPPFLQPKQRHFPQPLLIRLLLQTLHQLRCPSLDTLQHLNVSLVVRGPKLNTVFEGHDHCPSPAGHAIFDTSQDAIGFLGHLGTLLAHIQLAVNQHPQVLLCLAAFQPLFPMPVALHGVAVAQVQDLAFGLVEPHTIGLGPSIQPVQVPLQSLPTLQQINTPTQLGVICKLTEGALDPFVQIIDKDVKQNWPQHRALGNTACDRLPTGVNSIHHHSLGPAIQPVFVPSREYTHPTHEQPVSPGECCGKPCRRLY
ncbi:hypothetical protein QYF61_019630 [Mycteria americana]|uniref:Uncharacterized protein n=1 Tax=Mycteria americana TaxID=33587 RepID=A0AAN7NT55_MYCAM|nr:hypothetical protein QYF61_019630 [Mycteria americana]